MSNELRQALELRLQELMSKRERILQADDANKKEIADVLRQLTGKL